MATAASLPTRSAPFFFASLATAAIGKSAKIITSINNDSSSIYMFW
jgi:hypothetical protein